MKRGGILIVLIGLIVIVGIVMALFFLYPDIVPGDTPEAQTSQEPTKVRMKDIVRAKIDIAKGVVIQDSEMLELAQIPENEFNESTDINTFADVLGKLTVRDISAEQPIGQNDLTEPGLSQQIPTAEGQRPRDKAYPFIVNNMSGVSDQIKVGDFVDVVTTFTMIRRFSYPMGETVEEIAGVPVLVLEREITDPEFKATKTIVQRVQVLKIIRPQVPTADVTPEAESGVPPEGGSLPLVDASGKPIDPASDTQQVPGGITQGAWTIILAVNDQEIELLEFAMATNSRSVLVLRGAGDDVFEPTIGVTFDLLISEFGVPLPHHLPANVIGKEDAFTPEPTRTTAPTRVP